MSGGDGTRGVRGHSAPPLPGRSGPPGAAGRHCWVRPLTTRDETPLPGLLVEWRRTGDGFEGLVVYVLGGPGAGLHRMVQEWLPASRLAPRT